MGLGVSDRSGLRVLSFEKFVGEAGCDEGGDGPEAYDEGDANTRVA